MTAGDMLIQLYSDAIVTAHAHDQALGDEDHEYYITLLQLETIIKQYQA